MPFEMVFGLIGAIGTGLVIYNSFEKKSVLQATMIEQLKLKVAFLEERTNKHSIRLDDHDKQNQALMAMTQEIRHMSEDIRELKVTIKEKENKGL